jgi:hypothetical protein
MQSIAQSSKAGTVNNMSRLEFSSSTKREAYARSGGICECHRVPMLNRPEGCGLKLIDGGIFYEHINPDAIGPDNSLGNCAVLVRTCWREKTSRYDMPTIAKADRQRDRARRIKSRKGAPLPGTKNSGIRRRMDGTVVRR